MTKYFMTAAYKSCKSWVPCQAITLEDAKKEAEEYFLPLYIFPEWRLEIGEPARTINNAIRPISRRPTEDGGVWD